MTTKGRPVKTFAQHLIEVSDSHVTQEDYIVSPATAFLRYVVDAKDAANHCTRHFKKKVDGTYTKDGLASLHHIFAALLPAIMGHFETYQKYLFAGVFEQSVHLAEFNSENFFKKIEKEKSLSIDLVRLAAYRGFKAPVGIVLADSLKSWHNPTKVNSYFNAFGLRKQFYSTDDCNNLCVLWQLRHSIVHTGGSITLPDAQKFEELSPFGDKPVVFDESFILSVSRKFHPMIKNATDRIGGEFIAQLKAQTPKEDISKIIELFKVESRSTSWLK